MFQKDAKYKGFLVTRFDKIEELKLNFIELEHEKTKAKIIKIQNEDHENVFCLGFRTIPSKSNGVAHILEHTVLCGSEKYPVKDPFFSMSRRSLNTFMNAFTGPDFTLYPAASCVKKDFFNLLDVYMDAVFFPKLKELSFLQEGWRFEFENPEDVSSLQYSGIVFNEMKGAYANIDERLYNTLFQHLFPDITYGVDSGGNPKEIPNLSHQELLEFHKTFYTPSRSFFYFYGNIPLEEELDYLEETILKNAKALKPIPLNPKQKRFTEPKEVHIDVPLSQDAEDRTIYTCAYLTCPIEDQENLLGLQLLQTVLMDTDSSPLKHALLKSGFCKIAHLFLETDMSEVPLILTLKGCQEGEKEKIQAFLKITLEKICEKGFEKKKIESALHQLEFERLEISPDYGPYGLTLCMRSLLLKQNGQDPTLELKVHTLFNTLREKIKKEPNFLVHLIQKYMLKNTHHVFLTATLKKGVLEKENKEEKQTLQKIQEKLSEKEIATIVEKSKELKAYQYQQEHQDLEVLPKLTLKDIPPDISEYPLLHDTIGPFDLYSHTCFTNEILYVDLIFDLPFIKEEDLGYLQLFSQLLTEVGNHKYSYLEQLDQIQEHLGELTCQFALYPNAFEQNLLSPTLQISAKCLYPKTQKAFSILQDLILKTHFNEKERIKELLSQILVSLQNSINRNALGLASQLSQSGYYDSTFIHEKWYGLDFYWFVKDLVENFESSFDLFQEKMTAFLKQILHSTTPHIVLACSEDMLKTIHTSNLFDFSLPRQKSQTRNIETYSGNYNKTIPLNQGRLIASDVFFTALGFKTASYADNLSPYFCIASALMGNVSLHKAIREQGGAYGAGCRINSNFGTGYFFTYRDPNLSSSLDAFNNAIDIVKKGNYTSQELEEAKLINLQKIDMPIYPNQRALRSYGFMRKHKGLDLRLRFRQQIIEAGPDDVKKAIEYLEEQTKLGVLCVFGSEHIFEKEKDKLKINLPLFSI